MTVNTNTMQRIDVLVGQGPYSVQQFLGRLWVHGQAVEGQSLVIYDIYETARGRYAAHTQTLPWMGALNEMTADGPPVPLWWSDWAAQWRSWGNYWRSWAGERGVYRLEVFETREALRERLPSALYSLFMQASAESSPQVLDI